MIEKLLQLAIDKEASDLHLSVGRAPVLRVAGRLRTVNAPVLTADQTRDMMKEITPVKKQKELESRGSTDFSLALEDDTRFRVACFRQKGVIGLTFRLIPTRAMTFEEIGLPAGIKAAISRPRGLFLVTGPTGSGKTTTLNTIIDYLNSNFDYHIITIEDPVEFYHEHKKSLVSQREIGSDVPSFAEGLRGVFRQDPDVIFVGEMRDLETARAILTAAEAGYLVFSTLHTRGTASTIVRVIEQFPTGEQDRIRTQLSISLLGVTSQVLVPMSDGKKMVAAFEVMYMTHAIANLIREKKTNRLNDEILKGRNQGMITLDEYLISLYASKEITKENLLEKAINPQAVLNKIVEDQE